MDKNRCIRMSDYLWERAQLYASRQGKTVTGIMRKALEDYVSNEEAKEARIDERKRWDETELAAEDLDWTIPGLTDE